MGTGMATSMRVLIGLALLNLVSFGGLGFLQALPL